jgi:hypothetical protein
MKLRAILPPLVKCYSVFGTAHNEWQRKERKAMDTTTLIIVIVVLVLLFGGGGFYWRGRR